MATTSPTTALDKVPPEVRLEIFGLVLHYENALVRAEEEINEHCPKIDTALLTALVNDSKYGKAYDAFYGGNIFRLTGFSHVHSMTEDFKERPVSGAFQYVKHLELANFADPNEFLHPCYLASTLDTLRYLPKLKSLTIAYDSLSEQKMLVEMLREAESISKGLKLVCVGIGHFKLQYKNSSGDPVNGFVVDFKHYGLMKSWQAMKHQEPIMFEDVALKLTQALTGKRLTPDSFCRIIERYIQAFTLSDWVAVFDKFARLDEASRDSISGDGCTTMVVFAKQCVKLQSTTKVYKGMKRGRDFRNLDHANSSASVLEGVSELLLRNSATWPRLVEGDEKYRCMRGRACEA
ncbi:hypothetical protein LTR97_012872 [Elasticomyces elasticus]|uniref:Uncharacterized protein n=1 Tax=Elasticomyces elasticus TaxID=574655 RepID=A0AAN7W1A6_9PEZI|nr:hypothetical protein LTR97_012872 [Elasticomyces elasticus]